ncbi:hypothetical protein EV424DRAFT_1543318 [Suillus variegatus]|nr:hypothetical protein EV424DRAFT_1543318 [Suillus variegatus]
MPLRKKPRRSSPDLEAPAHRSSRPNCGVGGHTAQLQRVGERFAAPTRKGLKGNDLQISSSEENSMAPSQLQKGKKKNPPAKPRSTTKKNLNERRMTENSQHSQAPTSCLNQYVIHSSERFGFKEPQSNGSETAGWNVGQQDASHEKESMERSLQPSSHGGDTSDDNANCDDNNTPMNGYASQYMHQQTDNADDGMDFDKNIDWPHPDDEA